MASTTLVAAATLAARGSGGRSSVSGISATVFGATGFLGRYVVNQLGRIGSQVTATYRGDELYSRHLKVMGDLGQIVPFPFELRDKDSVRAAVESSSVVINVMGKHTHTLNYDFESVHLEGTRTLVDACVDAGVDHFIHVSCLPTTEDPLHASLRSPSRGVESRWMRTKLDSEAIVRDAFGGNRRANAATTAHQSNNNDDDDDDRRFTIVRPAPMFGAEDRLLTRVAQNITSSGVAILPNFGEGVIQPVWVNDVASVIAAAARDKERYGGKILELAGPDIVSWKDLYQMVSDEIKRGVTIVPMPAPIVYNAARLTNMRLPFALPNPQYSADLILYDHAAPVLDTHKKAQHDHILGFDDLDAIAVSVHSDIAHEVVRRFRRGGDRSSLFYVD